MALFIVETLDTPLVSLFMKETDIRLQGENMVKNPFTGRVRKLPKKEEELPKRMYLVVMEPLYPKVYVMGSFLFVGALFFTGFSLSYWLLPGAILLAMGFFWSSLFYYIGLRVGLHKKGYSGPIKLISKKEALASVSYIIPPWYSLSIS